MLVRSRGKERILSSANVGEPGGHGVKGKKPGTENKHCVASLPRSANHLQVQEDGGYGAGGLSVEEECQGGRQRLPSFGWAEKLRLRDLSQDCDRQGHYPAPVSKRVCRYQGN